MRSFVPASSAIQHLDMRVLPTGAQPRLAIGPRSPVARVEVLRSIFVHKQLQQLDAVGVLAELIHRDSIATDRGEDVLEGLADATERHTVQRRGRHARGAAGQAEALAPGLGAREVAQDGALCGAGARPGSLAGHGACEICPKV
eukprot:scaffold334_cov241-Pinguiococcus_pyrenoidosus.AAC.70